jgi:hypothetical protein
MGLYALEAVMFIKQYSVFFRLAQIIVPAQESFQHNRIIIHHEEVVQ